MPIISEEEYLAHYGRKGMKWYQHIYGDDKPKGTGRSRGSSSSSEQTNKKPNQTGTKSKYKSDEESDKALMARLKLDKDHFGEDNTDAQIEIFNEVQDKIGDSYSGEWKNKRAEENRKKMDNELNKLKTSQLGVDVDSARNEWNNYRDRLLKKTFGGNPYTNKTGKELYNKWEKAFDKYVKEYYRIKNKYDDDMLGIALEELGYRNTPKGRRLFSDYWLVFYD